MALPPLTCSRWVRYRMKGTLHAAADEISRPTREPRKVLRSSAAIAVAVIFMVRCVGKIPFSWIPHLGSLLGEICARFPFRVRKVTELNLKLSLPALSPSERHRVLKQSLEHTARLVLEIPKVWCAPQARLRKLEREVEGLDLLERAIAHGRGTILLTPHIGNWELLGPFLMSRGQLVALYRRPRIRELHEFFCSARERAGCQLVEATPRGLRQLLRVLENNQMLLILPDQEPLPGHGVHAEFFGQPAFTMTLVSRLLRKTGAEVLFVVVERLSSGFRTRFLEAPRGLADADPARAAASLNGGIEACVRLCPEQYQWSYKRYQTAPPGEPTPYRAIWSRRQLRRNPFVPKVDRAQ